MSERIHLQHLHSASATTVNNTVKADLLDGEIAILMKDGSEKIAFRNSADEVVYVSTDEANGNSYAPKSHSHNASDITGGTLNIGRIPTGKTSTTVALGNHQHTIKINGTSKTISGDTEVDFGNVETYKGTLTGVTVTAGNGLVSGGTISGSTGSKGGTVTLAVGAGTGITVAADAVSISTDYQNKINSGVTAYNNLATHVAVKATETPSGGASTLGHVVLASGDVSNTTYVDGVAAAAAHTHGQYLTGVTPGSGLAIAGVIANGNVELQLDGDTNSKLNSGVTAYNQLSTSANTWNDTTAKFNAFISTGNTETALDTLVELQAYIKSDSGATAQLITNVNSNTTAINEHKAVSASTTTLGHVIIDNSDLKNKTNVNGKVAGLAHTHSQYLTGYTETYKGSVTGVTAGSGLTGGGTKANGSTGLTLNVGEGTGITVTADAVSISTDYQNKINSGVTAYGWGDHSKAGYASSNTLNTHINGFNTHTESKGAVNPGGAPVFGHVTLVSGDVKDTVYQDGAAAAASHTHSQYLTSVTVDNHYTPTSSTTKSVAATEIITGISMDAKGHVTAVNKGSYTIAKSVPSDAVFTDTHHTGTTIVANASNSLTTASTIDDGSVRLNHIENNGVRSSILLKSDSFCDVKGTAANQITVSINTGTTSSTVARGDHSHNTYVNQNAFSNVKVGDTTIAADTTTDTLEIVAGESIALNVDATSDKLTISVTSIDCGTF